MEYGRAIQVRDGTTIQPLVGLQYIHLDQEAFTETGAGAANLTVDENHEDSLRSSVGVRLTKSVCWKGRHATPYVEGRWTKELLGDSNILGARFGGGGAFQVQGVSLGEDFWDARAGTAIQLNPHRSFRIGYDGQFTERSTSNGGSAQIDLQF